jgi:hypothetical protein
VIGEQLSRLFLPDGNLCLTRSVALEGAPFIPPQLAQLFPDPPENGQWEQGGDSTITLPGDEPGRPAPRLIPDPGETATVASRWVELADVQNRLITLGLDYNFNGVNCGAFLGSALQFGFQCANGGGQTGTRYRNVNRSSQPTSCDTGDIQTGICGFQNPNGCAGAPGAATVFLPACGGTLTTWARNFANGGWGTAGGGPQRWRFVVITKASVSFGNVVHTVAP